MPEHENIPASSGTGLISERQLLSVLNSTPALIAYVDADTVYRYVNLPYVKWLGKPQQEITGKKMSEVLGHRLFNQFKKNIELALEGKSSTFDGEVYYNGILRYLEANYNPDTDENGEVRGYTVMIYDHTSKKRIEKELQRKNLELQDHVENSTIGMHWVDGNGFILWANRAELEMLGYTKEEYLGHHISEFHIDREKIGDILDRLSRNESIKNVEARLLCKDESVKIGLINSNVFWENGRFVHSRCSTLDITEQKRLMSELQESR